MTALNGLTKIAGAGSIVGYAGGVLVNGGLAYFGLDLTIPLTIPVVAGMIGGFE